MNVIPVFLCLFADHVFDSFLETHVHCCKPLATLDQRQSANKHNCNLSSARTCVWVCVVYVCGACVRVVYVWCVYVWCVYESVYVCMCVCVRVPDSDSVAHSTQTFVVTVSARNLPHVCQELTPCLPGTYPMSARNLPHICQELTPCLPGTYPMSARNLPHVCQKLVQSFLSLHGPHLELAEGVV